MCKHGHFIYFREYWKNINWSVVFFLSLSYLFWVTSSIFKKDGNKDDLRELLMFLQKKSAICLSFFLIILIGMSKCWEALFYLIWVCPFQRRIIIVIKINGWKPLTIITKRSILDFAAALDPHLLFYVFNVKLWETKCFFFTNALYRKYAWVIFLFKDSFKSRICYVFCNRISFIVSRNIQILY